MNWLRDYRRWLRRTAVTKSISRRSYREFSHWLKLTILVPLLVAFLPYLAVELGFVRIGWPIFALSVSIFLCAAGFNALNAWQASMRLTQRRDEFLRRKGLAFDWSLLRNSSAWHRSLPTNATMRDLLNDPDVLAHLQERAANSLSDN